MYRIVPAILIMLALPAAAAEVLHFKESKPLAGTKKIVVNADIGAANFTLGGPAPAGSAYGIEVEHDEAVPPKVAFDGRNLTLTSKGRKGWTWGESKNNWVVNISDKVDLNLGLKFGAAQGRLNLGSLAVKALDIESGAATLKIRWDKPNRVRLEKARIEVGTGRMDVSGLGNANIGDLSVEVSAGTGRASFDGAGKGKTTVHARVSAGAMTLQIPKEIGISILSKDSSAGSITLPDDMKGYKSANYDKANHKVDLELETSAGSLTVRRP